MLVEVLVIVVEASTSDMYVAVGAYMVVRSVSVVVVAGTVVRTVCVVGMTAVAKVEVAVTVE